MNTYAFWNNKGGTGKTSLAFQALCRYAEQNQGSPMLAVDLCPQANLSELLLGGSPGESANLSKLHQGHPRRSNRRLLRKAPAVSVCVTRVEPLRLHLSSFDIQLPRFPRISICFGGDPIVELQANAIATLSNTQIPGIDTWLKVIDWVRDFLSLVQTGLLVRFHRCQPKFWNVPRRSHCHQQLI